MHIGSTQMLAEETSESAMSIIVSVTPSDSTATTEDDDLEWCDEDEDYDDEEDEEGEEGVSAADMHTLGQNIFDTSTTDLVSTSII